MELRMPKESTDAAIDKPTPHRGHTRLLIAGLVTAGLSRERLSPLDHPGLLSERRPEANWLE